MDKLDWPFAMLLPTLGENCLYELANNHVWRTRFAFKEWNTAALAYLHPPFGSQVGGHRAWLDYTHGMYYTLLNCGLRLPPSAGTANGVHPVPPVLARVCASAEGFSYDAGCVGSSKGGPLLPPVRCSLLKRTTKIQGMFFVAILRTRRLSSWRWRSSPTTHCCTVSDRQRCSTAVAARAEYANGQRCLSYAARPRIHPERSGWFALRFWESSADGQVRFAHSAPWYVEVDAQPVRIAACEKGVPGRTHASGNRAQQRRGRC